MTLYAFTCLPRFLSLCIIRFLSYYVLSVWGPRGRIMFNIEKTNSCDHIFLDRTNETLIEASNSRFKKRKQRENNIHKNGQLRKNHHPSHQDDRKTFKLVIRMIKNDHSGKQTIILLHGEACSYWRGFYVLSFDYLSGIYDRSMRYLWSIYRRYTVDL